MEELGPNSKVTVSIQTMISIVITVAMGVSLYYTMATESYVDTRIKELDTKVQVHNDKMNAIQTDVKLLQQDIKNHDEEMKNYLRWNIGSFSPISPAAPPENP